MKGFIGPISDDLPTLIAILLALSIFFTVLHFGLETYNEKINAFNKVKGLMDLGRKINSKGLLESSADNADSLKNEVEQIADSYALKYCIKFNGNTACNPSSITGCKQDWIEYKYLIAYQTPAKIEIKNVTICGG